MQPDTNYLQLLNELVDAINYDRKYNKIVHFKPYPYQLKFMNASAYYKQRMLRAGNRIGGLTS